MDYKAYTLMAILLTSLLVIQTSAAQEEEEGGILDDLMGGEEEQQQEQQQQQQVNETDTIPANVTGVPAINVTDAEWLTFDLPVNGETYPIEYMITGGTVENMTIHPENQTLGVTIVSTDDGTLNLRLPREVIDSQTMEGTDADFAAFIDNQEYTQPGEIDPAANDTRTLLIGFPLGAGSIEVIGTYAIPEFSTIAMAVLAVAIIGIVIASARYSSFNFGPRL
jgi:predicted secreted protein with PEFG-CTERM motif